MLKADNLIAAFLLFLCLCSSNSYAQWQGKFEQLGDLLPTPNKYRTGSGSPGSHYWQQQADYHIQVVLDDENQTIEGVETITYHNNSPDALRYLWIQLDQNVRASKSIAEETKQSAIESNKAYSKSLSSDLGIIDYEGGYKIHWVNDEAGNPLTYTTNNTMMRVNLPAALTSGSSIQIGIKWSYAIYDRMLIGGRGGYEYFPEDDNYLYTIAQWYPRMCVYDDVVGWQNKQFLGNGEFALTFGSFDVSITVPEDHIVAATGELQNENDVLSSTQLERLNLARKSRAKPIVIATEEEAQLREQTRKQRTKTWQFKADSVRDFAFATSRKFIWDAQVVELIGRNVLAMSFYPKEGNPLWERESTRALKNALEVYSERLFTYPYPVAISVNSADQGMEYPMLAFNSGRPKANGKYDSYIEEGLVDVVIHELGHNYFPMIINSDERLHGWMDEGINSYFELQTKRSRYPKQENWGSARSMIPYMMRPALSQIPIMSTQDNQVFTTITTYGLTSAALDVLREVILGPELFDFAFKNYAYNWKFKHPKPADFFRSMEDASGVDLDWFWRGWFYETDPVDISVDEVKWFRIDASMADQKIKNSIVDKPSKWTILNTPESSYTEFRNRFDDLNFLQEINSQNIYEITFSNVGGRISPIVIRFTFTDGSIELIQLPAEIWRYDEEKIIKAFLFEKVLKSVTIDPQELTGDVNTMNNYYPRKD